MVDIKPEAHRITTSAAAGTPFRILMTCATFEPGFRGGGPVRSVASLLNTLAPGIEAYLVTSDRDIGDRRPYPGLSGRWARRETARLFYLNTRSPRQFTRLVRQLHRQSFDALYLNSLFSPTFSILPVLALRAGLLQARRLVIAPRGELSPGALSLKRAKKRLFLAGWIRVLRPMNVFWQASADLEASQIKAVLPWAEVHIATDHTSLPQEPLPPVMGGDVARLVFNSRVSPMKNLDLILKALHLVAHAVTLDIFGPIGDARYWSQCKSLMRDLPKWVTASYGGVLEPSAVRAAFAERDAFIFPTRGENFGHVIAESLSASCPVLCSSLTPWSSVLIHGGGVVLPELTVSAVAQAIDRVAMMTARERLAARRAAAGAYRAWCATRREPDIFQQLRNSAR